MRTRAIVFITCSFAVAFITPAANADASDGPGLTEVSDRQTQSWAMETSYRACYYANQVRARYGYRALRFSESMTHIAARHSNWMAYNLRLVHQNIRGLGAYVGAHWLPVSGENIAMSPPRTRDVAWDAHLQWWRSPPHLRNMLNPWHTHCAVGIAYDRYGRWWGTQVFAQNARVGHNGAVLPGSRSGGMMLVNGTDVPPAEAEADQIMMSSSGVPPPREPADGEAVATDDGNLPPPNTPKVGEGEGAMVGEPVVATKPGEDHDSPQAPDGG